MGNLDGRFSAAPGSDAVEPVSKMAGRAVVGGRCRIRLVLDRWRSSFLTSRIGFVSEVDLMEIVIQDSYYDESMGIVADYMQPDVDVVDPDTDIYSLAERFHKEHRRRYPVVKNGRLVGQISRRDVLRAARDFLMHSDRKTRGTR